MEDSERGTQLGFDTEVRLIKKNLLMVNIYTINYVKMLGVKGVDILVYFTDVKYLIHPQFHECMRFVTLLRQYLLYEYFSMENKK